jgi:hypothetical protein
VEVLEEYFGALAEHLPGDNEENHKTLVRIVDSQQGLELGVS